VSSGNEQDSGLKYLDVQAMAGITKHTGGFPATEELLAMCHIEEAREVLEIGCGIGVGPVRMARKYGVRVMATDISEKMLDWARQRALEAGLTGQIEFRQADVRRLPFEDGGYDLVISESVLAFVRDKGQAIAEMTRVLKPGGWLGLNETVFNREPPSGLLAITDAAGFLGTEIATADRWREIWAASGLEEQEVRVRHVGPREELRERLSWVGCRHVLRAWARMLPRFLTQPQFRQSIKDMMDTPTEFYEYCELMLLAGRKPA